jgi:phage repressor protein C with HTH and peptisase S24 domain
MVTMADINILMGLNLRRLRESHNLTQAQLAELAGTTAGYISQLENGHQGIGKKLLSSLCKAFKVGASEFTRPIGNQTPVPPPSGEIAVISMCNGGPSGFYEVPYATGGGFQYIKRPYDVTDPTAYAVEIRGNSMSPRYEEGEMVIASPEKEVHGGDYVVVQLVSGEMAIKRIKFHKGSIILSSVNPSVEAWVCQPEEILAYHKVVWKKEKS